MCFFFSLGSVCRHSFQVPTAQAILTNKLRQSLCSLTDKSQSRKVRKDSPCTTLRLVELIALSALKQLKMTLMNVSTFLSAQIFSHMEFGSWTEKKTTFRETLVKKINLKPQEITPLRFHHPNLHIITFCRAA